MQDVSFGRIKQGEKAGSFFPPKEGGRPSASLYHPQAGSWTISGRTSSVLKEAPVQISFLYSSVQLLSRVQFFATPWTAARQSSLSITNSWSLPNPMSIELVMPFSHLILCHPLLLLPSILPSIRVFSMSQLFASGGQSIGISALASVPPMNTQDWSPLGWTGWISLQSKWLSRVFSNTIAQKHQFFGAQLSL